MHRLLYGRRWLLVLMVGCFATPALHAQEAPPLASEVEVIIFRLLDQRGNTAEVARDPAVNAGGMMPPGPGVQAQPASPYPPLPVTALRLGGAAAKLGRGAYQLLYHGGWTQEILPQNRAMASPLPADALSHGVLGSLTLYRERYLHAVVDIRLQGPGGEARMRQDRRLRGQTPQYFDHPQFGVILAVRPASPPRPEPTP